ncbi:MAG: carboxypeptidase regulatory-like domain-containing protein [Pseudonocardiaceae bacterium]
MTTGGYDLTLRGVTFAYGPHAEPVLRNLDLTVPHGDHLAVVGPSGIGKSTLAGLLCGLLRPDSGTVTIGGAIAAELSADRLALMRTLIPQEAYVFAATVWDNLTYLCSTATIRQVDYAVASVGAESLIAKLGGVSAELSPPELSAGERQLIALVRAYLSPAPVVVLDEATCHLDPVGERCAEEAFADRHGTLIVIAHRISSALRARRILVLDGVSATAGDHRTLLSTSPLYRELLGHWQDAGPAAAAEAGEQLIAVAVRSVPAAQPPAGPPAQPAFESNGAGSGPAAAPAAEPPAFGPHAAEPAPPAAELGPPPGASGSGAADLQHRPTIYGRVTESGNSPLAGATLTLTDLSGRQLDRDSSDSAGYYRLGPPTGGSYLVICASAAHQPTAALVAVADGSVRHDIVLSGAGASLSGQVAQAGTGRPVVGAVLTVIDLRGDVVGATTTEADGHFAFFALAQGHYTLTVAAASLQPVASSVEMPASGHVTRDVEVATRVQLIGVVRTATAGAPVPEALTTLIAADGQVVASAITDVDGGFVFDDLNAGVYTVIATGYPPVAAEVRLGLGAPNETVITLQPPSLGDVTRT